MSKAVGAIAEKKGGREGRREEGREAYLEGSAVLVCLHLFDGGEALQHPEVPAVVSVLVNGEGGEEAGGLGREGGRDW